MIKYTVIPDFPDYGITAKGEIYRLDKMRELKGKVIALCNNGKTVWFVRSKLVKKICLFKTSQKVHNFVTKNT